jgi:hypothetical protein
MEILEVYKKYKVMPQLQLHQLRVAAVAEQICDNLTVPVDSVSVIKACFLHDMANIIKFDLSVFPKFLEPEGLEYWQSVKDEYIVKYRSQDEHDATIAIAQELGVSPKVQELVSIVGFKQASDNAAASDINRKICAYADMRVGPHGIITLEDRLIDGAKRYKGKTFDTGARSDELADSLRQIENQIFDVSKIQPSDITDESTAPLVEQLKIYEI